MNLAFMLPSKLLTAVYKIVYNFSMKQTRLKHKNGGKKRVFRFPGNSPGKEGLKLFRSLTLKNKRALVFSRRIKSSAQLIHRPRETRADFNFTAGPNARNKFFAALRKSSVFSRVKIKKRNFLYSFKSFSGEVKKIVFSVKNNLAPEIILPFETFFCSKSARTF